MKSAAPSVRNFAVAGHIGSGKTSLCDLLLFKAGATTRLGKVADRTSVSDFTPDEQEKLSSIYGAPLNCRWKERHLFFTDTPGYGEFVAEPIAAIANADLTLVVVSAVDGVEAGCSRAVKIAKGHESPRAFFVNGMDKDAADFPKIVEQLQEAFGATCCVPLVVPVGQGAAFTKVANVLQDANVPEEYQPLKERLMDAIAETDEALMTRYLDGQELTPEEIEQGLKAAILSGTLTPIFAGSVGKDIGVEQLLDAAATLFPSPLAKGSLPTADGGKLTVTADGDGVGRVVKSIIDPFLGQLTYLRVFSGKFTANSEIHNISKNAKDHLGAMSFPNGKAQEQTTEAVAGMVVAVGKLKNAALNDTFSSSATAPALPQVAFPAPVMSMAITAVKEGEEEKIAAGLHKIAASDPTITLHRHPETHESLLSGMGDQHLANALRKLKEESKVEVHHHSPKVPYRETITSSGEGQHRHKKQSGGHGQFAEVHLRISPFEGGHEFVNECVGGSIPRNFIPAVEKGVAEAMVNGPLAGCKVENIKVSVYDGKFHDVDSSEMAFKIAARAAFRDAMRNARPILMEPIMHVKIMVPDHYMGDISGDLNHKRGRIHGMGAEDGMQVVDAEVPLAEMARYATELRSMTQGKGSFEMSFGRYETVPANVAKEIIDKHNQGLEEE